MANDTSTALSERERFLIDQSEVALRKGAQLLAWWNSAPDLKWFELMDGSPSATMRGFYDRVDIDGTSTSVMGCHQRIRFRRSSSASPEVPLAAFSSREFFRVCRWTHPDGLPGGFGYRPLLHKRSSGQYGRFSAPTEGDMDLSGIGSQWEWVLLQVDIFDFVRSFPPLRRYARTLSRFVKEAAYVVTQRDYRSARFPAEEGLASHCGLGYSFVPCPVHPNFFGFGPGRFGTAIKLFRFGLLEQQMQVDLAFLVAPRSEKVLYLGGFDPVYTLIHLIDALTLGMFQIRQRAHDKLDSVMLRQHGDVHQNFVQGMRPIWEGRNWV